MSLAETSNQINESVLITDQSKPRTLPQSPSKPKASKTFLPPITTTNSSCSDSSSQPATKTTTTATVLEKSPKKVSRSDTSKRFSRSKTSLKSKCNCMSSSCTHPSHRTKRSVKPVPADVQAQRAKARAAQAVKDKVVSASNKGKVFVVSSGYLSIREALHRRKWLQKSFPTQENFQPHHATCGLKLLGNKAATKEERWLDVDAEEDLEEDERLTRQLLPHLSRTCEANFIWTRKKGHIDFGSLEPFQIANHFSNSFHVTTKGGLVRTLEEVKWVDEDDAHSFFPRCHFVESGTDLLDFIDDYRMTTIRSLCRLYLNPISHESKVPDQVMELVMKASSVWQDEVMSHSSLDVKGQRVKRRVGLGNQDNNAINLETMKREVTSPFLGLTLPEWQLLFQTMYICLQCDQVEIPARALAYVEGEESDDDDDDDDVVEDEGQRINASKTDKKQNPQKRPSKSIIDELSIVISAFFSVELPVSESIKSMKCNGSTSTAEVEDMLKILCGDEPQLAVEGFHNMWVIKPASLSRGRGIFCDNRIHDILPVFLEADRSGLCTKWVIQKYIEDPLLVHDIKFDIRQWVVVTSLNPLTIYIYKPSYLRFSTAAFDLLDIRNPKSREVHLCNNSVQKHAKGFAGLEFAEGCMWRSQQLADYMSEEGHGNAWEDIVFPKIKEATVKTFKAAQVKMTHNRNCFEMFGLDFVIDNQLNVWLLEVNSSPDMSLSTTITAEMVPRISEDICKLMIDRKRRKGADIGDFELIFKGPTIENPHVSQARSLVIHGDGLKQQRVVNTQRLKTLSIPLKIKSQPNES